MEILVVRKWFTTKSTIGELYINDSFQCYTLEDESRGEGVKIKGVTCIPNQEYAVKITHSNRFNKDLPLIFNKPDLSCEDETGKVRFTGVRIHPGNRDTDTEGCILPGTSKGRDIVYQSRKAFDALFEQIEIAEAAGETVKLKITHEQVS